MINSADLNGLRVEEPIGIDQPISREKYIENILKIIAIALDKITRSRTCSLWLINNDDNTLRLCATEGMHGNSVKGLSIQIGKGIVGKVALEKKPKSIINMLASSDLIEAGLARKEGLKSMLSLPVLAATSLVGVLNSYTSHIHKFTKTELESIRRLADVTALALENTERMTEKSIFREELESRKIIEWAKDLLSMHRGLSGTNAYNWIQERSVYTGLPPRRIAEAIILVEGF